MAPRGRTGALRRPHPTAVRSEREEGSGPAAAARGRGLVERRVHDPSPIAVDHRLTHFGATALGCRDALRSRADVLPDRNRQDGSIGQARSAVASTSVDGREGIDARLQSRERLKDEH